MIKKSLWSQATGDGPPLFLIHGMGSASTIWKGIIPILEENFRVIAVDLPGHGNTPLVAGQEMDPISLGKSIFKLADDYGIPNFHLVGNSLGGWVALEMAALYPERIFSVTGLAPAGLWLTPYSSRIPGSAGSKVIASALQHIAPSLLKYEAIRKIGFSSVSPKWRELSVETCIDATLAMGRAPGYFPAWDAILKKRFDREIPTTVATTIIFGDTDNTLPARTCQERSLAPRHAKWLVLSECGHAPMWDQPDEVCAEIFATAKQAK